MCHRKIQERSWNTNHMNQLFVVVTATKFTVHVTTSRSAIAAKPRCSVCELWQKCNCEKRASNIALSYGAKDIPKC